MYTVVPLNGTQSVRSILRNSGVQSVDWSEIRNEHGQTVGFCIDRKFAEAIRRIVAEPNAVLTATFIQKAKETQDDRFGK